jgi:DNA-directed RNA polymerase subunit RPC12/RpoP
LLAITGRPLRCPDCGQFLREGAEHPRASERYLYYCKRCDVIWDTTIERSNV